MLIKQMNVEACSHYMPEELNKLVYLRKLTPNLEEEILKFKSRYDVTENTLVTFACVLPSNENETVVGYVSLEQNDIRTKFSFPPDTVERVYHEFTSIVLDNNLFNQDFLIKCFKSVIKQTVDIEKAKEEVFWFECQGQPISQIIDCGVLNKVGTEYEYHFMNEAEHFTSYVLNEINRRNHITSMFDM